jgi:hypothetical protein
LEAGSKSRLPACTKLYSVRSSVRQWRKLHSVPIASNNVWVIVEGKVMIKEIICTHGRLHKVPQAVINNPLAFGNGAVNRVELRALGAVTICQRRLKIDPPRATLRSALARPAEISATASFVPFGLWRLLTSMGIY